MIADIRMPVMDGLELIEEVRTRNFQTEIIILSGHGEFAYAQQALRFSVLDYILKPMKPEAVLSALEKAYRNYMDRKTSQITQSAMLSACLPMAEQLVEDIWHLNETNVFSGAQSIEELLRTTDNASRSALYADLVAFIGSKMQIRSNGVFQYRHASYEGTLISEQFHNFIDLLLQDLRKFRNWGHRQKIQQAIEYLHNSYFTSELSLAAVSEQTGISPAYLSRLFKEETGKNFTHYLTEVRMNKAKQLLVEPHYKTYEVAYAVGYADYPHFAKAFKKCTGLSPMEYRKSMGVF